MKILFLDIDGVLNSRRSAIAFDGYPYKEQYREKFDEVALGLIRKLCEKTDTKICLSSTWRVGLSKEELPKFAEYLNLPIISTTPIFPGRLTQRANRGQEIEKWLKNNKVTKYAIVDDDSDMLKNQFPYFVQTNSDNGLSYNDYFQLQRLLK